jgi:hypothetical protein
MEKKWRKWVINENCFQLPIAFGTVFEKCGVSNPQNYPARVLVPILSIRLNAFFSPRVSVLSK